MDADRNGNKVFTAAELREREAAIMDDECPAPVSEEDERRLIDCDATLGAALTDRKLACWGVASCGNGKLCANCLLRRPRLGKDRERCQFV